MNKTKIEWCDYTVNPIKGLCKHACSYCYARRMYKRFKWNPKVRYEPYELYQSQSTPKKSKIFICSTHDIMGKWIPDKWIQDIINYCTVENYNTFMFLTKNPKRYADFDFPDNCWLGKTITGFNSLPSILNNNKAFISFEPLLQKPFIYCIGDYDWIIVGGLTPKPIHSIEWVDEIIEEARRKNVPIFLKNNLHYPKKIQEFPK